MLLHSRNCVEPSRTPTCRKAARNRPPWPFSGVRMTWGLDDVNEVTYARWLVCAALMFSSMACAHGLVIASDSGLVRVPAGKAHFGSTIDTRAQGFENIHVSLPTVIVAAREQIVAERERYEAYVGEYYVMARPVTNREYFAFLLDTGAAEPWVSEQQWLQESAQLPYAVARTFMWQGGRPPQNRLDHPVVLISQADAATYCAWWGDLHQGRGSLPTEEQWEKAARGTDGNVYPWGDDVAPTRLNALESGIGGTTIAGRYTESPSPYGVLDMAGNVGEWTASTFDAYHHVVKGGSWAEPASLARSAARRAVPSDAHRATVGFRCVLVEPPARKSRKRS